MDIKNSIGAVEGDIVELTGQRIDMQVGHLYRVAEVGLEWVMVLDDLSQRNCVMNFCVKVVGKLNQAPVLLDIQQNLVSVGDTVAYAFAGASSRHLALFEVQQINGPAALCRSKTDGAVINLGVFEERAIKIKE